MKNQKVITFGEIMMRLSPPSFTRFSQAQTLEINYGGSEANVAMSLAQFNVAAKHVTQLPENDFGKAAVAHLQSFGVQTDHVLLSNERMGIYFIEHGAAQRSSKVIYDRFDSAFANLKASQFDWEEIFVGATWFHWCGITPALSQQAAQACANAITVARKQGIKISADINYRRNLWNYGKLPIEVMPDLISQSDMVIGDLPDFENCLGVQATDFADACQTIKRTFPNIKKIATTTRAAVHSSHHKISAVVWNGHSLLQSKEYELTHIVDRVGSGDAFMAGLIYGWLAGMNDQETVDFALAACALKHTVPGDVNQATLDEVEKLVRGVNVGKLLR